MKVALCVDEDRRDAKISDVFGRCRYFAVYDTGDKDLKFIENHGDDASRGAGIKAGQLLIDKKVERVYCSHIGPNAERIIKGGNIYIEIAVKAKRPINVQNHRL